MKTKLLLAVVILSVHFTFSQNLVAYYSFNGNSNDESGNANNGTVSGATLTPDRFGNTDGAYSFNGTNNYIQCLSPGPIGSSPRTISFWAKTNLLPSVHSNVVLSYGGDAGSFNYGDRIEISLNSYNRYGLVLSLGGSVLIREFDNSDNNWHFYTIAFEGGSGKHISDFKMYADGNLLTNTTYLTGNTYEVNTSSNYPILIGNLTGSYRYFNGSIDDIKVYDKALTETEIQSEFENLLAYYPLNGNANDLSGNGHDGSVFEASLTLDKDGNPDSAYLFDGVNDYIDIGDWTNGGAISFTFWARWDAFNSYSRIVDLGNGSSSNNIIVGNYQTQNSLFFSAYNGATETKMWTPTITLGQWDFYTTTVDANGIMTIYKNGIQIDQRTDGFTPNYLLRTEQFIGKSNFTADKYFKGAIDELMIYNKTLTIDEIGKLYNNNLIAYYPFNGNANDESGYGNHGTVNGATLTNDRFGNPDSAYSFDGSNDIITVAHNEILNISNELSISVWVKPSSQQNAMILGKSNYVSATNYLLRTKSTGYLAFEYKEFANSNSLPLIVDSWNHIAVVSRSDNSKQIYINGKLATHTSAVSPYGLVTNALTIGARTGAEYFDGSIDDLRMYKSALSESDVLNLYNNNALNILDQHKSNNYFYIYNNSLHFKENQNLSEIKEISIYNLLAQTVFESSTIQKETSLNFLQQGIYILKVKFNNGSIGTKKVIIQ